MAVTTAQEPQVGDHPSVRRHYRHVLWIALAVNVSMFAVELTAGRVANSVSLLADAIDFLGDAANYAASLVAFSFDPVWRSRTALLKGLSMSGYGLWILGQTFWMAAHGSPPHAPLMGAVSVVALLANVCVTALLFRHRNGDADKRSVWLCSRNDAIGNLAVLAASIMVYATGHAWPDLLVAFGMALLALSAGCSVIGNARRELGQARVQEKS